MEVLEKKGKGLNLTWEVRDGIVNHSMQRTPATLEGRVVRLADKIAYINHDIDDALRGHVITEEDLPSEYLDVLGHSFKERINTMIRDVIFSSLDQDDIRMSPRLMDAMMAVREYMSVSYTHLDVYKRQGADRSDGFSSADHRRGCRGRSPCHAGCQ